MEYLPSCGICFSNFSIEKLPITISCGHSICLICIINHEKSLNNDEEDDEDEEEFQKDSECQIMKGDFIENKEISLLNITKCPICRREINKRLQSFPVNFSIIDYSLMCLNNSYEDINTYFAYCKTCNTLLYKNNSLSSIYKCVSNKHFLYLKSTIYNDLIKKLDMIMINNDKESELKQTDNAKSDLLKSIQIKRKEDIYKITKDKLNEKAEMIGNKIKDCLFESIKNSKSSFYDIHYETLKNIHIEDIYKIGNDIKTNYLFNRYYRDNDKDFLNKERLFARFSYMSAVKYKYNDYNLFEKVYTVSYHNGKLLVFNTNLGTYKKISLSRKISKYSSLSVNSNSLNADEVFIIGGKDYSEHHSDNESSLLDENENENIKASKIILIANTKTGEISNFASNLNKERAYPIVIECLLKDNTYDTLVIGGYSSYDSALSSCEWVIHKDKSVSNLPIPTANGCGFSIKNKIYLSCSDSDDTYFYEYDLEEKFTKWVKIQIELDDYLYNHIYAPISIDEYIIFGGVNSDISDEEMVFNNSYFIVDYKKKQIVRREKVSKCLVKAAFKSQPAVNKYQIVVFDYVNDSYREEKFYFVINLLTDNISAKEII